MYVYYPAIIEINPDMPPSLAARREGDAIEGAVWVRFEDIPGCYGAGDDIVEATENARKAAAQHFEVMRDEGMELPPASALEDVIESSGLPRWMVALINVPMPPKSVRVNVTMDSDLLERIDKETSNRSAFLAEGARMMLERTADSGKIPVRNKRPDIRKRAQKAKRPRSGQNPLRGAEC